MPFRFVHTADIHLDSPLKTLAARDSDLANLVSEASRTVFTRIIDLCLDERVDALLIAGDLYDGSQTSMKTARFLVSQLQKLDSAGIKTFIIRGNHDAESKITRELTFPTSVHVFDGRGSFTSLECASCPFPIVVHGVSFGKSHAPESLIPKYRDPIPGAFNMGLLHTSFNGTSGHDPYAPCSDKELRDKGFDYWALGHIHKRFDYKTKTQAIVMPGIPQGRDINEDGVKSVTLGTVHKDRTLSVEERRLSIAQFQRVNVHLEGIGDWREMLNILENSLAKTRSQCQSEHLITRLQLTGATDLAWRLRRDAHDTLYHEALVCAERTGNTHIDKIVVTCEVPHQNLKDNSDTTSQLRHLIEESVFSSHTFKENLVKLAHTLQQQLPQEARDLFGDNQENFDALIQDWAQDGVENVLGELRLSSTEQED